MTDEEAMLLTRLSEAAGDAAARFPWAMQLPDGLPRAIALEVRAVLVHHLRLRRIRLGPVADGARDDDRAALLGKLAELAEVIKLLGGTP